MTIDVAVIGCGWVARAEHLRCLHKIDNVHVAAVCDLNEQLARETAMAWNIPAYYTDPAEMLRQCSVSIVDICTPPQTHARLAIQALESGCHVLLEKPMAITTKDAKKIMSSYKKSGMKLSIIHNWLFAPSMIKALSLIRKGSLGQLIGADMRILETNKDHMLSSRDHWCHSLPGGRFGEMLAHPIYVLQAILGELKVKSVSAAKISDYPWVSADELHVLFGARNAFGKIYASFNSPRLATYLDVYGTHSSLSIDVSNQVLIEHRPFQRFSIAFDNLRQAYQLVRSTVKMAVDVFSRKQGFGNGVHERLIRLFVKSVLEDGKPLVTPEEGYNSVRILEEICHRIDSQTKEA
jgi:predicted dehydrogenase